MSDELRGKIKDRATRNIVNDMSGLRWERITPTDVDAFIDFQNRVFIFIEAKRGETKIQTGQRLALERLCDACSRGGVRSVVFVCSWKELTADDEIEWASMEVREFYFNKKWTVCQKVVSLKNYIDWFRNKFLREVPA